MHVLVRGANRCFERQFIDARLVTDYAPMRLRSWFDPSDVLLLESGMASPSEHLVGGLAMVTAVYLSGQDALHRLVDASFRFQARTDWTLDFAWTIAALR